MQKWEYRVLQGDPWRDTVQDDLDKLGQDGWEVCAGGAGAHHGAFYFVVLKRMC